MHSRFLLSLLLISAGTTASAQAISLHKLQWSTHEKKFGITGSPGVVAADTTGDRLRQLQLLSPSKQTADLLSNATLSHETAQGKVYIMSQDNMRCLVPDTKKIAPMPTVWPRSADQMPNLYKVKPKQ